MSSSARAFVLGAVAYDPKVVTIWTGFREWFQGHDFPFDYVLYSHYERQVEDLLDGRVDAAWNSPLAWVRARRLAASTGTSVRALAMHDTDRDLTSVVVVRADSPFRTVTVLRGASVGLGAPFDHCNMTIGPSADAQCADRFRHLLLGMSYADPELRSLFDLEGLKAWCDGRTSGYAPLEAAVDTFEFYDAKGQVNARGY